MSGGPATWTELLDRGTVPLPETLASVDEAVREGGDRVLVVRTAGGLHVDVLLDRGLDLGAAWWAGVPIAWRSPHLVDPGPAGGWEDRFLGGLLATCGPDNIGPAREGHGQHGTHHLTPAHDVRWWRERTVDGLEVHVRGDVGHSALYGPRVVVEREVVLGAGRPWVVVRDHVRNLGTAPVPVALLYHVNPGAPLLQPGGRLVVDADEPLLREPLPPGRHPLRMPEPSPGAAAVVAEHRVRQRGTRSRAVLEAPSLDAVAGGPRPLGTDARLVVEWDARVLPRLFTWSWPAAGAWVLGVEPANAPMFGPERDLPDAGVPVLDPGDAWSTGVRIGVEPADARPG